MCAAHCGAEFKMKAKKALKFIDVYFVHIFVMRTRERTNLVAMLQTNDWAVWLILAFIVLAGVGLGLLTAWGNNELQITKTGSLQVAGGAVAAGAVGAAAATSTSATTPTTTGKSKTLVRAEEIDENVAGRKSSRQKKALNMADFNRPTRKSKCVGPMLIKRNPNRQPPKRPTSFGNNCGVNKSTITKEDVDVIYDEFNWVGLNGCFNEKGIYENPFDPKYVEPTAIELDGGVGSVM